jgi:hypothetical protein
MVPKRSMCCTHRRDLPLPVCIHLDDEHPVLGHEILVDHPGHAHQGVEALASRQGVHVRLQQLREDVLGAGFAKASDHGDDDRVDHLDARRGELEVVAADPRLRRLGDDIGSNQEDLAETGDHAARDQHEDRGDDRVQGDDAEREPGREHHREESAGDEQTAHPGGHHQRPFRRCPSPRELCRGRRRQPCDRDPDRSRCGQHRGDAEAHGSDQQAEPHRSVGQPFAGKPPAQETDRLVLLDLEHPRRDQNDPKDEDEPHDRRQRDQRADERAHVEPSPGSSRRKTSTIRQKRAGCSR